MHIGLQYGFRNPPRPNRPTDSFYRESLRQIGWADSAGFGSVWLSEHHFKEDGDIPSPLIAAAAVAASTERVRIGTNIVLLPLHHPLRLAEETALLAILSDGRFDLGIGAGYVPIEFEAFGVDLATRWRAMEEGIPILRQAWTGRPFRSSGTLWELPEVVVRPVPDAGTVPVLVGALAPRAIDRAARLGDGFIAGYLESIPAYLAALEKHGKTGTGRIVTNHWCIIAEDPERAWVEIGPHAVEQLNHYVATGGWSDDRPYTSPDDVLARGAYVLWDGAAAVAELTKIQEQYPQLTDHIIQAFVPGESIESSYERLEYTARTVIPQLAATAGTHP